MKAGITVSTLEVGVNEGLILPPSLITLFAIIYPLSFELNILEVEVFVIDTCAPPSVNSLRHKQSNPFLIIFNTYQLNFLKCSN